MVASLIENPVTMSNGGWRARVLADSISPDGARLITYEVRFPRMVLAEFNTHRALSRNSASSRAIPVEKMIQAVQEDPFIPSYWGKNQKGMQADQELDEYTAERAKLVWLSARDYAVIQARRMLQLGLHKQIANRLLEPFMWHTVIVTATDWSNFFALRCHKDAAPEIRNIAELMRTLYNEHKPKMVGWTGWHLPLIYPEDLEEIGRKFKYLAKDQLRILGLASQVSIGRCARVSYLTHDGRRDIDADLDLYQRLLTSRHMSPFEHVAQPSANAHHYYGNLRGWVPVRWRIPNEADAAKHFAQEVTDAALA